VLKTSAWGARTLNELNYQFVAHVNWLGTSKDFEVKEQIDLVRQNSPKKLLKNLCPFELPQRFWEFQLNKCEVDLEKPWAEVSKKHINKLIEVLVNDQYPVSGKTTFKEEFVTAGGIDLAEVDFSSMKSRVANNLYFAGEVLNIDGVTGGFNFQAAWTTGYIAGKHCLA
jgi:predicted Rossmann fold flavoprotein